jgi:prephenate dehydrogenase
MTVQITIIGLGQIGASVGLALANHKDKVTTVGHDKSPEVAQTAKKIGAVERVENNLPASVEAADIVLLAIPANQIHDTLKVIAQDLHPEAVLMDTLPVKAGLAAWIKELLPPQRYYVGLTPAVNPVYVEEPGNGIDRAHADLFQHGLIGISAPLGTPGEAIQLATGFASLLGAVPYFVDSSEIDGIMATAHLLPQLSAVALVNASVDQPGWSDIRKMAGQHFSLPTSLVASQEEIGSLSETALQNRENTVRVLDSLLAALTELRNDIAREDRKGLERRLEHARVGRAQWWAQRLQGDWQTVERGKQEFPRISDVLKQQVGGLGQLFRRKDKSDSD